MTNLAGQSVSSVRRERSFDRADRGRLRLYGVWSKSFPIAMAVLFASLALAQGSPKVTAVDPSMGKVNDNVAVAGENLSKATVSAIFLSDDKSDYKATIVDQAAGKIVMKVPQVKAGQYNISIQVSNGILIEPVHFTVE